MVVESNASRPVGEGELFATESAYAAAMLSGAAGDGASLAAEAVRRVRNELRIEAVSIVDGQGVITVSTSGTLAGSQLDNPVVGFGLSQGLFAASALPLTHAVEVDGVEEWSVGDTLYVVGRPMDTGSAVLLHYDISELLARRSQSSGVETATIVLVILAAIIAAFGALVEIGRARAASRMRMIDRETELLRAHGAELERSNIDLEAARAAAEDALALAEEKNRIRSEFVLMINHELRTPLTSVLTGAHLLAEIDLPQPDRDRILQDMLRDGARLEEMISQILEVARIENRGLTSSVRDVTASSAWATIGATVGTDILGPEPSNETLISTDPSTLATLIASLVDNARQHGASMVHVIVSYEDDTEAAVMVGHVPEPGLTIAVVDDGPGIDPEFLPRAFEKFEKDSFSSGTGLGLYVVRLMAEAIDASISVRSTSKGTTFTIALPRALTVPEQRITI